MDSGFSPAGCPGMTEEFLANPSSPATNVKRLRKGTERRLVRVARRAKAEAIHVSTVHTTMDCFAEPVIGRAFARPVGSQWRCGGSGRDKSTRRANRSKSLSSPSQKDIPLNPSGKSKLKCPPSRPKEGRIAIVTDVGAGCGGRDSVGAQVDRRAGRRSVSGSWRARRTALMRTAKPCGPDTRCWCQVARRRSRSDRIDQP